MLGPIDDGWGVSGWVRGIIGALCFIPGILFALLIVAHPTAYTIGFAVGVLLGTYVLFRALNYVGQKIVTSV